MGWANSKLKKIENSARAQDRAKDVARTVRLFDATIYIYAGTVLGKQLRNLGLKNMSSEVETWTR
jgi:hypothetical protein